MSEFKLFYLKFCPYCREVFEWIDELKEEHPEINSIELSMINESENTEYCDEFDYYYVPSFYYGNEKLHEGVATKEGVLSVFQQAMDRQSKVD